MGFLEYSWCASALHMMHLLWSPIGNTEKLDQHVEEDKLKYRMQRDILEKTPFLQILLNSS